MSYRTNDPVAGDITGTLESTVVTSLTGSGGLITIDGTTLQFANTVSNPEIIQLAKTADVATQSLTIQSQAPYASAITNITPGNIVFNTPAPIGSGAPGAVQIESGGTLGIQFGQKSNGSAFYAGWFGTNAPSGTNYAITANGTDLYLNSPSNTGTINLSNGSNSWVTVSANNNAIRSGLAFNSFLASVSSPTINQIAPTTDVATANLNIQSQSAFASAVTNINAGSLILDSGTPATGGTSSLLMGTNHATAMQYGGTGGNVSTHKFYGNGGTQNQIVEIHTTNSSSLAGFVGFDNSGNAQTAIGYYPPNAELRINGYGNGAGIPVNIYYNSAIKLGVQSSQIAVSVPTISFGSTQSSPVLNQGTLSSDTTIHALTIQAQNAFATATTNTTGGNLILQAGAGATSNATFTSGNVIAYLNAPNSGGTEASFQVQRAGSTILSTGTTTFLSGYTCVWASNPGNNTWILASNSAGTIVNAPSTQVTIGAGGGTSLTVTGTAIECNTPIGGINVPFHYTETTQALTTGTTSLAQAVYQGGHIKFTGTLTGANTIVFPSTIGAQWYLDFSAVVFSGNAITLQANSVNWGTTISAGTNIYLMHYSDAGKLYGVALTP